MALRNESTVRLVNWINPRLRSIELVLGLTALIGLGLKAQGIPFGGIILLLSLSSLGMAYFFNANSIPKEPIVAMEIFANKLTSYGSAVAVVGILFRLQNWPGFENMLIAGCAALSVSIVISFVKNTSRKDLFRSIVIIAVGAALFLTSKEKLVEMHILHNAPPVAEEQK